MATEVIIGIGSNEGDRLGYIRRALCLLGANKSVRMLDVSSVYENPAHILDGASAQGDYLNAVCAIETDLRPRDLLRTCLSIELECGRKRSPESRWESRTVDLDILLYGKQTIHTAELSIPHERIAERNFVLVPLGEIRPYLHIPSPINASVQYLLDNCPDTGALRQVGPGSILLGDEQD